MFQCMYVNQKVRIHSEYLLIRLLLFEVTFLTKKQNNGVLYHIVTLKVQVSVTIRYQWMYAFRIAFRASWMEQLSDSFLHFHNILESVTTKQDASSEDQKDESRLVPSRGRTVDVQDTPVQTAATRLPSIRLCGVLASSEFHRFGPLKKLLPILIYVEAADTNSSCPSFLVYINISAQQGGHSIHMI
jgi:hypothetical protein